MAPVDREIVMTVTGPDRVGIVETVTRQVLDREGNIDTSRMARLGGEFAMLLLVTLPGARVAGLEQAITAALGANYRVSVTTTQGDDSANRPDGQAFQIHVEGADHEGIINQVARYLSERGINIESLDTETAPAPVSGTPLFLMTALVLVPAGVEGWEDGLDELAEVLNLDIDVLDVNVDDEDIEDEEDIEEPDEA